MDPKLTEPMNDSPYLLELHHVAKAYDSFADAVPVQVLSDVNLRLQPGSSLSIAGPSGSGKSTLLNIIGSLDHPSSGKVLFNGQNPALLDKRNLARLRNRSIGFIFQFHHLLPQCTVLENVLIPTLVPGAPVTGIAAWDRAHHLLQRIGLDHRLNHRPGQISGGERQRAAFVRALINSPRLILADEPTGALDPHNARLLMRLLIDLNREEGVTLIVVTHAAELAQCLDQTMQLQDGRLIRLETDS